MVQSLNELIQNRKDLIEAHRKNDFTDGIHALLTDLYPDTAHFIYELLQNAEDMKATIVRFNLHPDGIDFEHNGTKRSFNLSDIDAITNIGHNGQKKDDPTSIGKFGVGFKAVFAYTSTPEIHSGEYHFRIKDYFVPEFDNVPNVSTRDSSGIQWTKFYFPFNNPKKPKKVAYKETLLGLEALDDVSILFLQNISRIEYHLPNGSSSSIVRIENDANYINIHCDKKASHTSTQTNWLRFYRPIQIKDDQGNQKNLSISIAYALKQDKSTQRQMIVPVQGGGKTFIYFPAEKEHSGLRFHINAPFASTVARDSVRACSENDSLISQVSHLISDSLEKIKKLNLLNAKFFEVLPNKKDNLTSFYQVILNDIIDAFAKNPYLPAKNGGYIKSTDALISSPAAFSNLFQNQEIDALFNIKKKWIVNASQTNSNTYNFLQSLGIQQFNFDSFERFFDQSCRDQAVAFLEKKNTDWFKKFYSLCYDLYEKKDYYSCLQFDKVLHSMPLVLSSQNKIYPASDIYILPINCSLLTKSTPIVHPSLIESSSDPDRECSKAESFLRYRLDIAVYGPRIEIEKKLTEYDKNDFCIDNSYFETILEFARYNKEHNDIDFSSHSIFYYTHKGRNYRTVASNLVLGPKYGFPQGPLLANVLDDKYCISDAYQEHYSVAELQLFKNYATQCGVLSCLSIEKRDAHQHPLFYTKLYTSNRRLTDCGTNEDYTIPELDNLLKKPSTKISQLIWETLERYGGSPFSYNRYQARKYAIAAFSPNGSSASKECDSSLIYSLKNSSWLPDKNGNLHKPEDLLPRDLSPTFKYNIENPLIDALQLGSALAIEKQKRNQIEKDAQALGLVTISAEEYQEFQKFQEAKKRTKESASLSSQDLLKKQNKKSTTAVNDGDDFSTSGAVNNIKRRENNIEASFRNAKNMRPQERKLFSRVIDSSKNEKKELRNWYQGHCQICDTVITNYQQQPYFVAKNIISTRHLTPQLLQTVDLAWNSLCLCPNCAARYDVCSRDISGLYDQIMEKEVIQGDSSKITISIVLDGVRQEIHYIPKHFLALKKVLQLNDEDF